MAVRSSAVSLPHFALIFPSAALSAAAISRRPTVRPSEGLGATAISKRLNISRASVYRVLGAPTADLSAGGTRATPGSACSYDAFGYPELASYLDRRPKPSVGPRGTHFAPPNVSAAFIKSSAQDLHEKDSFRAAFCIRELSFATCLPFASRGRPRARHVRMKRQKMKKLMAVNASTPPTMSMQSTFMCAPMLARRALSRHRLGSSLYLTSPFHP